MGEEQSYSRETDTQLGQGPELEEWEQRFLEAWKPVADDHPLYRPGVHLFLVGRRDVRDAIAAIEPTTMIRQGDVLLVRVESLPAGVSEAPSAGGRVVLARSESTAHAHVFSGEGARLCQLAEFRYLTVEKGGVLTHEEHDPIGVPAGIWEVRQQRQYSRDRAARRSWTEVVD